MYPPLLNLHKLLSCQAQAFIKGNFQTREWGIPTTFDRFRSAALSGCISMQAPLNIDRSLSYPSHVWSVLLREISHTAHCASPWVCSLPHPGRTLQMVTGIMYELPKYEIVQLQMSMKGGGILQPPSIWERKTRQLKQPRSAIPKEGYPKASGIWTRGRGSGIAMGGGEIMESALHTVPHYGIFGPSAKDVTSSLLIMMTMAMMGMKETITPPLCTFHHLAKFKLFSL